MPPHPIEPSLRIDELARTVIGAAIEVHRQLGPGLLESLYRAALESELAGRSVRTASEVPIAVQYRGAKIGEYRLDLLVEDELVVELKSVEALAPVHVSQVLSYLKIGGFSLALLINFNVRLLRHGIRRVVLSGPPAPLPPLGDLGV